MGAYKHMKDFDYPVLTKTMNELGTVKIGLKKIYTSPAKSGTMNTTTGHLFTKEFEKHMVDEYGRERRIRIVILKHIKTIIFSERKNGKV